ncbi:HAMP domain-containing sensor histidine kinase [Danxiaibacter flavus]|uniref:histidine kinase n=1 Tax=Danxiaibacter flavus TaxID=3049108 RepID=A0ABV3Z7R4_9BACT|nr:HAMP domain-containing sensor histidine kinase [Chitinophagaceae bacterium DXS]
MKKTLPVIVILITLALFGIFAIQVSWFRNVLQVQEQRLFDNITRAMYSVAQDVSTQPSMGPTMRSNRRPSLQLPHDNFPMNFAKQATVAQRFTDYEIHDKILKALIKQDKGLKKLDFEFGITSDYDDYVVEMQSKNFMSLILDSTRARQIVVPIAGDNSNYLASISAYENLWIVLPDFKKQLWRSLTWLVIIAAIFTIIILAAFYLTLKTMLNQKKLSEIKSDFINNMTHEFKTPLATISLAVDALKNEKVQNDRNKMSYFSGIIKEENKRMNKQVETILQAGLMERQDIKMNMRDIHAHEIIHTVMDNFNLQLQEKNAHSELLLNAANDNIIADEVHFTNLINNLVDNAVKYSKENLVVRVSTHSTGKNLVIRIEDNGIGMSKETVKRIFEKFYRAHTGNVHNVKGFGLGMSYVKTIVDAHKGKIKVDSTPGKGSAFTIEIPLRKD